MQSLKLHQASATILKLIDQIDRRIYLGNQFDAYYLSILRSVNPAQHQVHAMLSSLVNLAHTIHCIIIYPSRSPREDLQRFILPRPTLQC